MELSHWDDDGNLKMVDVSSKKKSHREATAEGFIKLKPETFKKIKGEGSPKGDILTLSKTAGINASKLTPRLIPMCHPVSMTHCDINFKFEDEKIRVLAKVKSYDRTGVEMEALTAANVTLLNLYDMVKPLDKSMEIGGIKLVKKSGGKSGNYVRES